ncbi:pentatricopeptide repeat-containing protein 5, mitochondrial [Ceratobasidium sp. AG-Ba]|nr:pentatricopeptide repeat-containing protein 5, mitochondrial [Ceratobasidium sp. AG-Ba]
MSLRAPIARTAARCPKSHTSSALRISSTPHFATTSLARKHIRPFSSTPSTSRIKPVSLIGRFFGVREPPPVYRDPEQIVRDLVETLCVLLRTKPPIRPALLHKPYAELVSAVLEYRNSSPKDPLDLTDAGENKQISKEKLQKLTEDNGARDSPHSYLSSLISALVQPSTGSYPHPADLELALRVHADLTRVFMREPTYADTVNLVWAYALLRNPQEALSVASTMDPPLHADGWAPIACAFVLSLPNSAGDELRKMMRTMAARGVEPPLGAWVALLSSVRPEEVVAVLKALPEVAREEADVWVAALNGLGERKEAKEVAVELKKRAGVDARAWAALVAYAGLKGGYTQAEGVVKEFEDVGGIPDASILRALVGALSSEERTPDALRRLENALGVAADEDAWGIIVDATDRVVEAWEAARESGVNLTSRTLDRVVGRNDVPVVERLRVYREVSAAWPVGRDIKRKDIEFENGVAQLPTGVDAWMRREDTWSTPGPTIKTYTVLLTGLAGGRSSGMDKATASAAAVELLNDMRQRGITFSHIGQAQPPTRSSRPFSSPLAALTLLLMQDAPSHEAAFKMYAYARVVDPKSGAFGIKEYKQVLRAFAELRVSKREEDVWKDGGGDGWADRVVGEQTKRVEVYAPPPAALYYEIMRDMQHAGYEVGVGEYTTILKAYAAVSIPSEPDPHLAAAHNSHVLEHVQRIHTLLKLDTNLTPDTGVLNALMKAYGHVGSLDSALAIWDQMQMNRPGSVGGWDGASVSIIIDALGRSGRNALPRARRLWDGLKRRHGGRLNKNNYTSWVEALCRMGEFEEAERVVYVDMRGKLEPDEKTLRTLVSFAWRVGRQAEVLEDVRRRFPGVV